jgi:hypothetical protein
VSTVQVRVAGDGSAPAAPSARTENVCVPSATSVNAMPSVAHGAKPPP